MKKGIIKSALAIAAIAAVGLGSYKAYKAFGTKQTESDMLLVENVEALTAGDVPLRRVYHECYNYINCIKAQTKGPETLVDVWYCPDCSELPASSFWKRESCFN